MGALLEVEDLTVWLATRGGPRKAVDGLSFQVDAGEIFGIAGESGSGKTMTALALLGLLPHAAKTAGRAVFEGRDLLAMPARELRAVRGRKIAMVSQDPSTSLHPMLSIETQLTEHMRHHLGLGKSEARGRAVELLATVRIPDPEQALRAHPAQFSGGMRQRIAIAVALACEPRLLLADEPTTALDVTVQAGILRLLHRLRRERDLAVIVITHDLGVMSAVADRICVMYGGRTAEVGPREDVLTRPRHPYTRGLLDALPHPEGGAATLQPIPGSPPALGAVPEGCPFHPRCGFAVPDCRAVRPEPVLVASGHLAACPPDPLGGAA
ncbi:peptide ABC transporter ATP-binding protein [Acrocarpospora phusangensis]|uniref:Peptide ABC transporter ATP-binding protein n=1 Tax=Acrocarpospora phusangensis TaxID=1070424 RepID=A0A919Q695_9ACTN|nr:ABC transporter ATP-binding protein [Acrocarpospora phusangensis]GIH21718.1 peptide ABC transporter ATP-binding protein [Acrocarpospora phusangensis]